MKKFAYAFLGLCILSSACTPGAEMNADSPKKAPSTTTQAPSSDVAPSATDSDMESATDEASSGDARVATTDASSSQPACVNHLLEGITDPASGRHFRLMPYDMPYCDGAAACANLAPGAIMIWAGMTMPDEVEACGEDIGYWYQNYQRESREVCNGFGLITVGDGELMDWRAPASIICTY